MGMRTAPWCDKFARSDVESSKNCQPLIISAREAKLRSRPSIGRSLWGGVVPASLKRSLANKGASVIMTARLLPEERWRNDGLACCCRFACTAFADGALFPAGAQLHLLSGGSLCGDSLVHRSDRWCRGARPQADGAPRNADLLSGAVLLCAGRAVHLQPVRHQA